MFVAIAYMLLIALVSGLTGYAIGLIDGHKKAEAKVQRMKTALNAIYGRPLYGRFSISESPGASEKDPEKTIDRSKGRELN